MLKGTVEDLLANRLSVDMKLTSTSSSISIEIETKEGYPTSYSYEITGPDDYSNKVNNTTKNTYTFDKLNLNTEYSIKVIVKNKANLTKEITKTIKTELVLEPELGNLIPVVYQNNNWVVVDPTKDKWYDYENQEWANAVILNDGINKIAGQELNLETDVRAMFVWIPRYEYKIEGPYGKGGVSLESPGEIEINFISKETVYSGANSSGYRVHPAFKFGTEELSGIWVGKFETSVEKTTDCYVKETVKLTGLSGPENTLIIENATNSCNNANQEPYILPNVSSLRYQSVSNQFKTAQKLNSLIDKTGDSHQMKNSEWGVAAYLSQSKFGKYGNSSYQKEDKSVEKNLNSDYLTGGGNYIANIAQSTTGNITGIYDMNGGAWEYVMGVLNKDIKNSEFDSLPDTKYYDSYTSTTLSDACNGGVCYGHALSETAGWYGKTNFVLSNYPWLVRGSFIDDPTITGIFTSSYDGGQRMFLTSFRIVITSTT